MTTRRILFSLLFLCFLMISSVAKAQFEGHIAINIYSDNDGVTETSYMNIYTTKDRVIIKGDESLSLMEGSYNAEGILIRNDKKDFIILTGEDKAVQFTKEELEGFFQMIAMMSGDSKNDVETDFSTNFNYTNKVRNIQGYDCTELLISNNENDNTLSLWLTSGIDINWGVLTEPWKNVPKEMKESADRLTQEFKSKSFPLMIEVTEKGKTETVFEVTSVNRSAIGKAEVEIPAGVKLVGLTEFIFSSGMNGF